MPRDIEERVLELEAWRHALEIILAEQRKDREYMDLRFNRVDTEVGDLKKIVSRVSWVVILSVLGAFMTWVLKGGLASVA